jgi:hypothetical protein
MPAWEASTIGKSSTARRAAFQRSSDGVPVGNRETVLLRQEPYDVRLLNVADPGG